MALGFEGTSTSVLTAFSICDLVSSSSDFCWAGPSAIDVPTNNPPINTQRTITKPIIYPFDCCCTTYSSVLVGLSYMIINTRRQRVHQQDGQHYPLRIG